MYYHVPYLLYGTIVDHTRLSYILSLATAAGLAALPHRDPGQAEHRPSEAIYSSAL